MSHPTESGNMSSGDNFKIHELPNEIIPLDVELTAYPGLDEIRFRKDGKLVVGLFVRQADHEMVVAISGHESAAPYIFPVKPEVAVPAFEHPYGYAPRIGKQILQDILVKPAA